MVLVFLTINAKFYQIQIKNRSLFDNMWFLCKFEVFNILYLDFVKLQIV